VIASVALAYGGDGDGPGGGQRHCQADRAGQGTHQLFGDVGCDENVAQGLAAQIDEQQDWQRGSGIGENNGVDG